ncbi:hypothetical protein WKG86_05600 [Pantoea agglomerans]|jgi:acetyl-CoA carboxylase beta subunit|uniref:Uncharacterized protein n=1 Tax=Enterobacter agglomerans TaxID=549 RepID=A0ACC5PVZ6_ENTAG|nr:MULTISPECIES: hypothetical protein [Pantoea]MBD8129402.1 hypothetical protein [Pantoea agglomerans]MBD8181652.1 hypothetical protein [Pantoea agglomerans]MDH1171418.1 hypothetical protein [Pantoea agglomerans]WVL84891.1 hypothetical protein IFU02_020850 [Pantoea agglomerans]
MPKKHVMYQAELHKNLARVEFCKAFNPKVAEKLRQILDEHKAKEKRQ